MNNGRLTCPDKEIDMELTVTVYSASFKKLAILNTLERTVSTIMLSTIGFFKPLDFLSGLSEVSPVADVHEEIQKQLSVYGLFLYPSSEGGIGNCFFLFFSQGITRITKYMAAYIYKERSIAYWRNNFKFYYLCRS